MPPPWRVAAYWLVPHSFLSMFSDTAQGHLSRAALVTMGWTLPHESLSVKALWRLAYHLIGSIFSTEIPFSQMTRVCVN